MQNGTRHSVNVNMLIRYKINTIFEYFFIDLFEHRYSNFKDLNQIFLSSIYLVFNMQDPLSSTSTSTSTSVLILSSYGPTKHPTKQAT